MKLSDFDYNLPKELIAQYPARKRDESRLLVLHKDTGIIEHRIFKDIIEYLNPGDLLVLNNTKVLPARLIGRKETGGKVEALILQTKDHRPQTKDQRVEPLGLKAEAPSRAEKTIQHSSLRLKPGDFCEGLKTAGSEYEVLLKPTRGCKIGSKIIFGDGELNAEVARIENGRRFLKFDSNGNLDKMLDKLGQMPLPPYIKREADNSDTERYQTVYASKNGAVAAPTAGLHFTKKLLDEISEKRVGVEYVTLHVGYGTFKPVSSEDVKEHKMEKEYFEVEGDVIAKVNNKKGRVIAVGTTSARVLESFYGYVGTAQCAVPTVGWTELFIYPGYKFKIVDGLLTNFHLPKTTLLMLVAAFCGVGNGRDRSLLFKAYEEAIKEKYRFYSYGDAMLILGATHLVPRTVLK